MGLAKVNSGSSRLWPPILCSNHAPRVAFSVGSSPQSLRKCSPTPLVVAEPSRPGVTALWTLEVLVPGQVLFKEVGMYLFRKHRVGLFFETHFVLKSFK